MNNEVFENIIDYKELYEISNQGTVKSVKLLKSGKIKNKILKPVLDKDGYLRISLSKNGISKQYLIHKLVCEQFIKNIENKETVNHIDGIKTNNFKTNLEWATRSENIQHAYDNGLLKKEKGINNPRNKPVIKYSLKKEFIKKYNSITEAFNDTGIHISNISKACTINTKAGGFIWKFTVILMFFSVNLFSQNEDVIKGKNNTTILSESKTIDQAKINLDWIRQSKSIDSLQKIIDFKDDLIEQIREEHVKTLTDIAKANAIAKETTKEVDEISDDQLRKERFKWKGLHLYGGVEVPNFEFNSISINTELMYELERIEFGLKGSFEENTISVDTNYKFIYYLKLRYKFF